ncbi:MAG: D-alanine--D-alanine ligase [Opitutales bacterium]
MSRTPRISVVCGGTSAEREVSIGSGIATAKAFSALYEVERIELDGERLPVGLDAERCVVFSTLHGTFGEDGGFQSLLDNAGIEYAGCGRECSELTFDKVKTKATLAEAGVPVADQVAFSRDAIPNVESVFERLGPAVVLKPVCQGSSVGLGFANSVTELESLLAHLEFEEWMLEPLIVGKEISIGVLEGEALEIVEIRPESGQFDYASKYTKGMTEYIVPAPFSESLEASIKLLAMRAYEACGCRDYTRVDFMLDEQSNPFVLELNTLPGMKATSLLPMSAGAAGINFEELLKKLVAPAFLRFQRKYSIY